MFCLVKGDKHSRVRACREERVAKGRVPSRSVTDFFSHASVFFFFFLGHDAQSLKWNTSMSKKFDSPIVDVDRIKTVFAIAIRYRCAVSCMGWVGSCGSRSRVISSEEPGGEGRWRFRSIAARRGLGAFGSTA